MPSLTRPSTRAAGTLCLLALAVLAVPAARRAESPDAPAASGSAPQRQGCAGAAWPYAPDSCTRGDAVRAARPVRRIALDGPAARSVPR